MKNHKPYSLYRNGELVGRFKGAKEVHRYISRHRQGPYELYYKQKRTPWDISPGKRIPLSEWYTDPY